MVKKMALLYYFIFLKGVINFVKKRILIIFTGGTITMKDFNGSIDISKKILSKINSSTLLSNFDLDVEVEIFSSKPSPKFSISDMLVLGKFIDEKISCNSYDGFVIAHGTDTIEETSFFLNLYFSNLSVPIVLTGSMKVFSDNLYDGYDNLISSIFVASNSLTKNYGVLVIFKNIIMSALHVSKFHTENLDSFKSIDFPNVGTIESNNINFYFKPNRFNLPKIDSINDDVFIYKTYSGDSGYFLENSNINYSALVIEGFGSGNVSEFLLPKIKDLLSNGIPVAICTRVPEGPLKTNYNYPGGGNNLRELGCIFYNSIDSHKMRIFLAYLISCKFSFNEINTFFKSVYNKNNI